MQIFENEYFQWKDEFDYLRYTAISGYAVSDNMNYIWLPQAKGYRAFEGCKLF